MRFFDPSQPLRSESAYPTGAEIQDHLSIIKQGLNIPTACHGRPIVDRVYSWWLNLYAKAAIFHSGGWQFELQKCRVTLFIFKIALPDTAFRKG